MNYLLLGLRASGKTTLGRALAEARGLPFIDLDELTPRVLGEPDAASALRRKGEGEFRKAEAAVLEKVLRADGQVVALGGGTPTGRAARSIIERAQRQGTARALYLRAEASTLRERLSKTDLSSRPALLGNDPLEEVEPLFSRRDPVYLELADEVLTTDGKAPEALVTEALVMLGV